MFFDLHCDLLLYLAAHPYHFAYDAESRVSISQMLEGKVQAQTMAIFTPTDAKSVERGIKQAFIYKKLASQYKEYFESYSVEKNGKIKTLLAIENASAFCGESESLDQGIARLQKIVKEVEKPLYISLTWHTENRFGGGNHTKVGLKDDGRRLLSKMQGLCSAIDLSHTSDLLAQDILNYIDREKLPYKILASHSNLRKVQTIERNLPDEIADEIVKRKGIIGLGIIRHFVGEAMDDFLKHVEYGLKRGYGEHLAIGADFFCEKAVPKPG
ncbi:MAG: hypothetical protein JWO53_621 [Chlamydiia bacterium]|nr:hypothetical protein [Chlamydiia bacterium]